MRSSVVALLLAAAAVRAADPPPRLVAQTGHNLDMVASLSATPDGRFLLSTTGVMLGRGRPSAVLWDVETGRQLGTFHAAGKLHSAAVSPDGRFVVVGGDDGRARLWDVASGKVVRTFGDFWRRPGTTALQEGMCLSYRTGKAGDELVYHAAGMADKPLRTVPAGGDVLWAGQAAVVGTAYVTREKAWFPTAVEIHSIETGELLHRLPCGPAAFAAVSPAGRLLVEGRDGASVWDIEAGVPLTKKTGARSAGLGGQPNLNPDAGFSVVRAAFSPDGVRVALVTGTGEAFVCDAATGTTVAAVDAVAEGLGGFGLTFLPNTHPGLASLAPLDLAAPAFSADGRSLQYFRRNAVVRRELATGKEVVYEPALEAGSRVRSASFAADGTTAAVVVGREFRFGSLGGVGFAPDEPDELRVVQFPGGKVVASRREPKGIDAIAFAADGSAAYYSTRAAGQGGGGRVSRWEAATGKVKPLAESEYNLGIAVLADPKGKWLAISDFGNIRLVRPDAGALLRTLESKVFIPWQANPSADGRRLAIRQLKRGDLVTDNEVVTWDLTTGSPAKRAASSAPSPLFDSGHLAVAAGGRVLGWERWPFLGAVYALRDIGSGQVKGFCPAGDYEAPSAASADGRRIAIRIAPARVAVYDAATAKLANTVEYVRRIDPKGWGLDITAATFMAGDSRLITLGNDGKLRLWDMATGKPLFVAAPPDLSRVTRWSYSPDGKRFVAAEGERFVVRDATTGAEIAAFPPPPGLTVDDVSVPEFAGNKTLVVTDEGGVEVRDLDVPADAKPVRIAGRPTLMAADPSGATVCLASDAAVTLAEVKTGKILSRWKSGFLGPNDGGAYLTAGGKSVLFTAPAGEDGTNTNGFRLCNAATGKTLLEMDDGLVVPHTSLDGSLLVTARVAAGKKAAKKPAEETVAVVVWNAATGAEKSRMTYKRADFVSCRLTPDGKRVIAGGSLGLEVRDAATGKKLHAVGAAEDVSYVESFDCSNDGSRVAFILGGSPFVWEVGKKTTTMLATQGKFDNQGRPEQTTYTTSVAVSEDGKTVVACSPSGRATAWDATTAKFKFALEATALEPAAVAESWSAGGSDKLGLSADGARLLTTSQDDGSAALFDVATGAKLAEFARPSPTARDKETVTAVRLAADGKSFAVAANDFARVDAATGRQTTLVASLGWQQSIVAATADLSRGVASGMMGEERRTEVWGMAGPWPADAVPTAAEFSADGRFLFSADADGVGRVRDGATGRALCEVVAFGDGGWAVIDPDGRFDASAGGDIDGLHWVVGTEPVELKQLKERYYEPGLLAKVVGFNKEPLRKVEKLAAPKLFPAVEVGAIRDGKAAVTLTNRGGGIGKVVVRVNGKELSADARPRGANPDVATLSVNIDLKGDPRMEPGKKNRIEVIAYNADGYLSCAGPSASSTPKASWRRTSRRLWAVVGGVSDYKGDKIDLRYAAKDADDFAAALKVGGDRLFGADRVKLAVLTTTDPARRPTRDGLLEALDGLKASKPADVVVIYLAGHGVTHGGDDGNFYFLTADAATADLTDPEVRAATAVSSRDADRGAAADAGPQASPRARHLRVRQTRREVDRERARSRGPRCGRCNRSRTAPARSSSRDVRPTR